MKLTYWAAITTSAVFASYPGARISSNSSTVPDPYDQTALFLDYGFLMDNYDVFTKHKKCDSKLFRRVFHAMQDPIRDYLKSFDDDEVTPGKRKSTIIGLIDLLSTSNSTVSEDEMMVTEEDWKKNEMSAAVITQGHVNKLIQARNQLFACIGKKNQRKEAYDLYLTSLSTYRETLTSVSKKDYDKLITRKKMDWGLYKERYITLLESVKGAKGLKRVHQVKTYLAKWLRTGDKDDSVYETLTKNVKTKKKDNGVGNLQVKGLLLSIPLLVTLVAFL